MVGISADWTIDKVSFLQLLQSQGAGRSSVAALAVLVWDVCTTIDDEVELIWVTPWAFSKCLYLFSRYYSLIAVIIVNTHQMSCLEWLVFEGISALILELAGEMILILRIYAMYIGNNKLLYIMTAGLVVQGAIMIVSLGVSIPKIMTSPACIETSLPIEMILYTITSIVYETLLFSLTITRYFIARKTGWQNVALMEVLFRDGAWAFVGIFCVMITNTALFTFGPSTLASIGFPWLLTLLGVLSPRLITNIRAVNAEHLPPSTISGLRFSDLYFGLNVEDPDDDASPNSSSRNINS